MRVFVLQFESDGRLAAVQFDPSDGERQSEVHSCWVDIAAALGKGKYECLVTVRVHEQKSFAAN